MAYTVERCTGEVGMRMALGAQTMDVLRLVIAQGMKPVVIGLFAGLAAALALGRLLAALLACLLPARKASLPNPARALRAE